MVGVTGSIPVAPTIQRLRAVGPDTTASAIGARVDTLRRRDYTGSHVSSGEASRSPA